ncbi:MAG: alpha/beta hydrolase [Planctomycetota bacterium]
MKSQMLWAGLVICYLMQGVSGAGEPDVIVLWPDGVPEPRIPTEPAETLQKGSDGLTRRFDVSNPRLIIHRADQAMATGAAMIIVPGGGFGRLADEHEGSMVASWLNQHGITAIQLVYRTPTRNHPSPVLGPAQDLQKAILTVREKARELLIDPHRIGAIGFSAGGQTALVATAGKPLIEFSDDTRSARPDLLMLIYPYEVLDEQKTGVRTDVEIASLPPTFIAQAADDPASPPLGSAILFRELLERSIPVELHIYESGGHGFGLKPAKNPSAARDWPGRAIEWLERRSFAKP